MFVFGTLPIRTFLLALSFIPRAAAGTPTAPCPATNQMTSRADSLAQRPWIRWRNSVRSTEHTACGEPQNSHSAVQHTHTLTNNSEHISVSQKADFGPDTTEKQEHKKHTTPRPNPPKKRTVIFKKNCAESVQGKPQVGQAHKATFTASHFRPILEKCKGCFWDLGTLANKVSP